MGYGVYGYGVDFHNTYHNIGFSYGQFYDSFGFFVATFGVGDQHLGVYLVSLLTGLSTLSIVAMTHLSETKSTKSVLLVTIVVLFYLHSWPILMSVSNAMRQGVMMSLIFLLISSRPQDHPLYSLSLFVLSTISHKAGVYFAFLYLISFLITCFTARSRLPLKLLSIGIIGVVIHGQMEVTDTRVIRGDFSLIFVVFQIMVGFAALMVIKVKDSLCERLISFVGIFCLTAPHFWLLGYNWEYERIVMVGLIPTLLAVGLLFRLQDRLVVSCFLSCAMFLATLKVGLFAALH